MIRSAMNNINSIVNKKFDEKYKLKEQERDRNFRAAILRKHFLGGRLANVPAECMQFDYDATETTVERKDVVFV